MKEAAPYFDLGSWSRDVSSDVPEARTWFDRGLIWTYGFNHEEAIRCFERAAAADPDFGLAHWGVAYAIGPNYNKPWEAFEGEEASASLTAARDALARASELAERGSDAERALVEALAARYPDDAMAADPTAWNDAYADAMRLVYERFPDDLDVMALCAEALMNRTPWALWDLEAGQPAEGADTGEAMVILEKALETSDGQRHPGVLHMYVHLMEMSPHPERALRAADWLRGLVPDSGHLEHMPTHIDVLCGHYRTVVEDNGRAMEADERYVEREGALNFYSLYRCHNVHFKMYGAMFLGQFQTAISAADQLVAMLSDELLEVETPPMADWLEGFVPMRVHVLIRFGKWQELIDMPLPTKRDLYCTTTAMMHYGKGVALAASGDVAGAEAQRELFDAAVETVPDTRYVFNNSCLDILGVAREMLLGELEYRRANYDAAFAHLRRSIELDDGLTYDEPWGWMQPTRHAYGALLLEQGHIEEAEAVYRADLGLDESLARAYQHPENVWSLHGYHECLQKTGKTAEARFIKQRLDLAVARADVPIKASCFCRLQHQA